MLLSAQNVKKEYGIQKILDIGRLEIQDGDRIASSAATEPAKARSSACWSGRIAADGGSVRRSCEIAEILRPQSFCPAMKTTAGRTTDQPHETAGKRGKKRRGAHTFGHRGRIFQTGAAALCG